MTGRVIRFPIADPLETALVAATELNREQLEQLRDQVAPLLAASCPPATAAVVKSKPERPPFLGGLPQGTTWWRLDRVEADSPRRQGLRAISVPAAAYWWAAALNLPEGAGSRDTRVGHERRASQPQRMSRLVRVPGKMA